MDISEWRNQHGLLNELQDIAEMKIQKDPTDGKFYAYFSKKNTEGFIKLPGEGATAYHDGEFLNNNDQSFSITPGSELTGSQDGTVVGMPEPKGGGDES